TLFINTGVVNHLISATTTVANGVLNAFSIATSTSNIPIFSVSTLDSPVGTIGIGTSTVSSKLAVEMAPVQYAFEVANTGSSTPGFVVGGVNMNGAIGIGENTPLYQMEIASRTNNGYFGISSSTSGAAGDIFSVTSNGNVGVGTTSPLAKFSIH